MFTDLQWSRGDLALSISIGSILAAIAGPFVGAVVDKHGATRIMIIGSFLTGVSLILLGSVHQLWQAFLVFSLVALFRVGFVSIPVTVMVSNWFVKKRGRALGIMTAGQGLGGLILSPLTIFLISSLGWRMAWVGIGVLTWIITIPATLLLAKPRPEIMGLTADGISPADRNLETAKDNPKGSSHNKNYTMKEIFKMPVFWLIALLYPIYFFGHVSIFQHGYSIIIDKGLSVPMAAIIWSILGLFSLGGKIILGYLSDKIPVRYVMMIALCVAAASVFSLILVKDPTWSIWTFIIFWGFFECGVIALQPILVASTFNRSIMGKMLGIFTVFTVLPQLVGPAFLGYVFDSTGSYNLGLYVILSLYLVSLVMVFFTQISKNRPVQYVSPK